jgi:Family of unknown function (DUF6585)
MTQLHPPSMSSALPGEVSHLAGAWQLGAHVSTFPPGKRWRLVISAGVLALIFGGIAISIASLSVTGVDRADPLVAWSVAGLFCLVLVALTLWPAATGPLLSAKARERKFYVFEHGFVHVGRKGTECYRFDAVAELRGAISQVYYNGIPTGTNYKFDLYLADGRRLKLNTFSTDMASFAPPLQQAVAHAQVPRFWAHLIAGGSLQFGKFLVTAAGIATERKPMLAWSEVPAVIVDQGYVIINQRGKRWPWARVRAADTPNLYAFVDLAGRFIRHYGG